MTKFRHLIWMVVAFAGLMLSALQSYAQQPDVGDQPGLLPDDSVELDPEYRKQMVYYRTNEAPGTIIISTAERHLYLVQPGGRALRYGIGVGVLVPLILGYTAWAYWVFRGKVRHGSGYH